MREGARGPDPGHDREHGEAGAGADEAGAREAAEACLGAGPARGPEQDTVRDYQYILHSHLWH